MSSTQRRPNDGLLPNITAVLGGRLVFLFDAIVREIPNWPPYNLCHKTNKTSD